MRLENLETSPVSYRGKLAKYAKSCGWVLCVGAGTSDGVFPCWNDLAKDLFRLTHVSCSEEELTKFLTLFGAEAMMQAAANALSKDQRESITDYLSKALYQKLQEQAGSDWKTIAKALTSSMPFNLNRSEWKLFGDFVSSYDRASAPQIASAIAKVLDSNRRPEAILSFNAEPLLYGLINCHYGLVNPEAVSKSGISKY